MSFERTGGADWRQAAPAVFLLLAAALGGLRTPGGWAVFSALFIGWMLVFERDMPFSLTLPVALLLSWLAAGLYFSPEPLNSFWHFSKYLVFAAFFAFARSRGEDARKYWVGGIIALGCLAACFGMFERAILTDLKISHAGVIGGNPNYGAAFMAAGLACVAASWPAKDFRAALPYGALAVFLVAGLVAVNSRGAALAVIAAAFFLFWLRRARWGALCLGGTLLLAAVMISSERLGLMLKLEDPRSLERLHIWTAALDAVALKPLFGLGLGLFERGFEFFKFPFFDGISWYGHSTLHAHSEPLNLAAEAGVPAAALLLWAWASAVFPGRDRDLPLKALAFVLFVQAAADVIFYSGAVQLCFFGTLGLLAPRSPASPGRGGGARIALCLAGLALAAALALRTGFERDGGCALRRGPAAGACLGRALGFSPGDQGLRTAAVAEAAEVRGNPARAAALAADAAFMYPKNPFLAKAAAEAAYAGGDTSVAKAWLFRAVALEPHFLSARLGLVQLLAGEKDAAAASAELKKLERSLEDTKAPAARRHSAYDAALLYLPPTAYGDIRTWKKELTGRNTASARKAR